MKIVVLFTLCLIKMGVPQPALVEYSFSRSECLANSFGDKSVNKTVGTLSNPRNNSICLDSNGIGFQVQSVKNVSGLMNLMGSDGFTVGLWIQPQLLNDNNFIMSFNAKSTSALTCQYNMQVE